MRRRWRAPIGIAAITLAVWGCGDDSQTSSGSSTNGTGGDGGIGGTMSSSSGNTGGKGGSGGAASSSSGNTGGNGGSGGGSGGSGGISSGGGSGGSGGISSGGGSGGSGGISSSSSTSSTSSASSSGQVPECMMDAQCDDGFSCTADTCSNGVCVHAANHAMCDDQDYCTGIEVCNPAIGMAGTGCTLGSGNPCDDGIGCTADTCDSMAKQCSHTAQHDLCNNGAACDGMETCDLMIGCKAGTPLDCNDNIPCTDDFCDIGADACAHVANDSKCTDGLFCNGVETCNEMLGCQAGTPINCNDGIGCTADACNEATNACSHTPNSAACDDGLYCNGNEVCDVASGCQSGLPVICNDGLTCTADSCSNALQKCVYTPNNAACDDGLKCNGVEFCDANGAGPSGCKNGMPVVCPSDGIACTIEACNEPNGTCTSTASNGQCPMGQFCVPPLGGCTPAKPCQTNAECNDGNACNGIETCNLVCQPGQPVTCDDGVPCTIDSCNPQTGACLFAPNNAICDDGLACNGVETCQPAAGGCAMGMAPNCDDGVMCTFDECLEPTGSCVSTPQNQFCNDIQFCNGVETCTAQGCVAGAPPVCNDGIACTTDSCSAVLNACVGTPDNTKCGCGETCSVAAGGCGNFCQVATCQGKVYSCGDCLDNDGDCKIDSQDTQCLGPCDNTEDGFYGGIPGQNNSPCKSDCYFDQDTGSGNDDCYWSHKCDPLEVAPNYPPEGSQCAYNPNANIAGYSGTCADAFMTQSTVCLNYCGPLTPNGCDCFGCCALPGVPYTVWLGSENPSGTGSCNINTINDPTKCKPCTQVQACLNTCDVCEICIGKPNLPPSCTEQTCPAGVQKCGQVGQQPCPAGQSCITGCCVTNPG